MSDDDRLDHRLIDIQRLVYKRQRRFAIEEYLNHFSKDIKRPGSLDSGFLQCEVSGYEIEHCGAHSGGESRRESLRPTCVMCALIARVLLFCRRKKARIVRFGLSTI